MISIRRVRLSLIRGTPCNDGAAVALHQDPDNFSTLPFLANAREHSSQQFLSGSMVSLVAEFEYIPEHSGGDG